MSGHFFFRLRRWLVEHKDGFLLEIFMPVMEDYEITSVLILGQNFWNQNHSFIDTKVFLLNLLL